MRLEKGAVMHKVVGFFFFFAWLHNEYVSKYLIQREKKDSSNYSEGADKEKHCFSFSGTFRENVQLQNIHQHLLQSRDPV